jgi:hypothetical protein
MLSRLTLATSAATLQYEVEFSEMRRRPGTRSLLCFNPRHPSTPISPHKIMANRTNRVVTEHHNSKRRSSRLGRLLRPAGLEQSRRRADKTHHEPSLSTLPYTQIPLLQSWWPRSGSREVHSGMYEDFHQLRAGYHLSNSNFSRFWRVDLR